MSRRVRAVIAGLSALVCACASAPSADPAFERGVEAERRYARGLRDASLDDLLGAARLLASAPPRALDGVIDREPGLPLGESREVAPASAGSALAAARSLVAGDPAARARVDAAARDLPSIEVPGPRRAIGHLGVGARDLLHWRATSGAVMEVVVLGDGRAAIALEVVDDHDRVVCAPPAALDEARCRWVAEPRRLYDAVVRNAGRSAARYVLLAR
ncbi:MAG: hypothetical protein IT385_26560 [Deltaproteobacteria bacterium]|nr:hypothetical protein [Deltaproteobacteria bacterium]